MIVDNKIELETKLLKDYPDWQFLPKDDLNRKTIQVYFDLKMKHASLALKETHKLSETRKDIARIKTQINQEKRVLGND